MALPAGYSLRRGSAENLDLLAALERAAASSFAATPYAHLIDAPPSIEEYDPKHHRLWIAAAPSGAPVGFALAETTEGSAHLLELDVHPDHQARGIGTALIGEVARWAEGFGLDSLTLTTFASVPWNGPYYERRGFRPLRERELTPHLSAILREEARMGLPREDRIAMILHLPRKPIPPLS